MAILPDLDISLIPLYRKTKNYYLSHRAGSHSYFIGFIVSIFIALIFTSVYEGIFWWYLLVGFLFYSLHVSLDLITTSKTPIFYPLSKKEYRLNFERAVNPALMVISFCVVLFFLYLFFNDIDWGIRFYFRNVFFVGYYGYFFYRAITKIYINLRLSDYQSYLPGILPFVYYVYEKNSDPEGINIKLIKKIQYFPVKKELFNQKISNDSEEMKYYKQALEYSNRYRYFIKWEGVVPIIKNFLDRIFVLLFLSESYGNGSAYSLKLEISKKSGRIIHNSDGFYVLKRVEKKLHPMD